MRWTTVDRPSAASGLLDAPPLREHPCTEHVAGAGPGCGAEHPAVTATARALEALGATGEVVLVPAGLRTAAAVAGHLGAPTAAVARSALLRTPGGEQLLVVASAVHELFPPVLAAVLGVPDLEVAGEVETARRTGSVLGSASPVGLAEPLPTYVDVTLALHPAVWVPAGHPRAFFRTRYDELLRLAGAHPVETG
ncbi:aminoacyl-tRNA deacylase [Kineococcus gurbantunggutensis]|uniref:aminoacyl-tRNA deacylase n=1 Tax=Kineococcus sp. SYSU DK005 TaxID=3383126 RepID=UPI003D7D645B